MERVLDVDDLEAPDLPKLAGMGADVIESVREIRAMLATRADVLETCRTVLADQHANIVEQRKRLERDMIAFCDEFDRREAKMTDREARVVEQQGTVELRIQQLARQKDDMIALRQCWEAKISELNAASTNLSTLREQLVEEVGQISSECTDLLGRFGLTERSCGTGAKTEGGLPPAVEPPQPDSLESYRTISRDVRRRPGGSC
jgi:chaperonin cofactor prefoldin